MLLVLVVLSLLNPVLSNESWAMGAKKPDVPPVEQEKPKQPAEEAKSEPVKTEPVKSAVLERLTLGVVYTEKNGAADPLKLLTARLERSLILQDHFTVLGMTSRQSVIKEQAVQNLGMMDNPVQMGRLLGAQKLIQLDRVATGYTAGLVDVETGKLEGRWAQAFNEKIPSSVEIAENDLIAQILQELSGQTVAQAQSIVVEEQAQHDYLAELNLDKLPIDQTGILKLTTLRPIVISANSTAFYFDLDSKNFLKVEDQERSSAGYSNQVWECTFSAKSQVGYLRVIPKGVSFVIQESAKGRQGYYSASSAGNYFLTPGASDRMIFGGITCFAHDYNRAVALSLGELTTATQQYFQIDLIGVKMAR